jgi:hypothetical protein
LRFDSGSDRLQFNFVSPGPLPRNPSQTRLVARSAGDSNAAPALGQAAGAPSSAPSDKTAAPRSQALNDWLVLGLALGAFAMIGVLVRRRRPRPAPEEGEAR